MIPAYDKLYLSCARTNLGRMLDFAVYELHYKIEDFYALFLSTGVADDFGRGDFTLLAGMSGVELAYTVLERAGLEVERSSPSYPIERSEAYWTGWALAYYQWASGRSFAEIDRRVPIRLVQALYSPYHEMDIRQFCDRMEELYVAAERG